MLISNYVKSRLTDKVDNVTMVTATRLRWDNTMQAVQQCRAGVAALRDKGISLTKTVDILSLTGVKPHFPRLWLRPFKE